MSDELYSKAFLVTRLKSELAEARAERDKYEGMLKAAQQLLITRGSELHAARHDLNTTRNSNIALRDELISPKRPVGRIEALEARLAKLERLSTAR